MLTLGVNRIVHIITLSDLKSHHILNNNLNPQTWLGKSSYKIQMNKQWTFTVILKETASQLPY